MGKFDDITGRNFGRLTVINMSHKDRHGSYHWNCICDCGNKKTINGNSLRKGNTKSCGCLLREKAQISGKACAVDLTGERFGRLVAIKPTDRRNCHNIIWECLCDCGAITFADTSKLKTGNTKSCGCLNSDILKNRTHYKDLAGQRFGRLTAVKFAGYKIYSGNKHAAWECKCDCGNTVEVSAHHLKTNSQGYSTKSCGCLLQETLDRNNGNSSHFGGSHINMIKSKRLSKANKSGYKGVCFNKYHQKWQPTIKFKGKSYYLGRYDVIEEAAKVRKQAEEMLFEPFLEWYYEKFPDKKPKEIT